MRNVIIFLSIFILTSCASVRTRRFPIGAPDKREAIVLTAEQMLGSKNIIIGNKKYNYDCAEFVRAVYLKSLNIDLFNIEGYSRDMRGVEIIYKYCKQNGRFYRKSMPYEGDIVFFNETYDADRDGKLKDELTHLGIVEKVDEEGTITFIHLASNNIRRSKMNLKYPHINRRKIKLLNDYLRKKNPKKHSKQKILSGELFETFGSIL